MSLLLNWVTTGPKSEPVAVMPVEPIVFARIVVRWARRAEGNPMALLAIFFIVTIGYMLLGGYALAE
jgi:hypothetical protein